VKVPTQSCFILHQRHYRETSLILEVFSRQNGRLALVARGAKRSTNKTRALMQLNQKLYIAWTIRGEMGTLTSLEAAENNYNLDGDRLIAAFYLNELLMRLLHKHVPHPELFDTYEKSLKQLGEGANAEAVLRLFEKQLLESLGYGLILDHDVISGKPLIAGQGYHYHLDYGPTQSPLPERQFITVSGATLLALAQNTLYEQTHLQEAKLLTRWILKSYLGERPLASRDLFNAYLKNKSH